MDTSTDKATGASPQPDEMFHRRPGLASRKLDSIFNALGTKDTSGAPPQPDEACFENLT